MRWAGRWPVEGRLSPGGLPRAVRTGRGAAPSGWRAFPSWGLLCARVGENQEVRSEGTKEGTVNRSTGARGLFAESVTHPRVCLLSPGGPPGAALAPGPLGRHLSLLSAAVCAQVSLHPARSTWSTSLSLFLAPGERPGGEESWPGGLFSVQGDWEQPRDGGSEPRSPALGGSLHTQGPCLPRAISGVPRAISGVGAVLRT